VGNVVLEHVVLGSDHGELLNQAGVALGIKDYIAHAKQGEAGRCCQEQRSANDEPFAMFLELKRHNASLGLIGRLQALRAGWVQPVQGETFAVVQELAWQPQNLRANLYDMNQ
jgi:hypothetical protein